MTVLHAHSPPGNVADCLWSELLADDRPRYSAVLEEALSPQREYLTDTEYAIYRQGKLLRPAVLFLAARMAHGPESLPKKVIQGAVSLEMLHVATLIHDDVVDGSALRRGRPSVNAARGGGTAVIVGDLQFVQAIRGFVEAIDRDSDMDLVKMVLDTAFEICCGELDELRVEWSLGTRELVGHYWRTVDRKTAVLFGLAAESGVRLAGGRLGDARRAGFYGRALGRAFQVMDDLFDLARDERASGKPRGIDLVRGRATLPLIYAREDLGPGHRVSRLLRGDTATPDDVERAIDEVRATPGYARAYAEAREQALNALEYLRPFPPNRYRFALEDLALQVVDRAP
ncbi:polyprenyl synthetase family protein [Streptomyces sp. NPDC007100]|uniref:polyprenyl synthetase family protein n=1 Tax=Streptomyces sp. NPDC007100 TaxID=3155602 RepID=UPI0033E17A91